LRGDAWTIDVLGGRNAETGSRLAKLDSRNCVAHPSGPSVNQEPSLLRASPCSPVGAIMNPPEADWSYVDRLKKMTRMKPVKASKR